jgi:YVTN family beta-propeller protein
MRNGMAGWESMAYRALLALLCAIVVGVPGVAVAQSSVGPRQSSPIALTSDDRFVVNVNPDANSITAFEVHPHRLVEVGEIPVGGDPSSIAIHPGSGSSGNTYTMYVANALDGTVSVVTLTPFSFKVTRTIAVGAEPAAVALSPHGTRLYVANSSSNSLSVINTANNRVIDTVDLSPFGTAPRAIAVTNNGHGDADQTVFVAMFFGQLRPNKTAANETQDDQREGRVVAISAANNRPLGTTNPITLSPISDTGFNSNGKLSPGPGQVAAVNPTNPQTFTTTTDAFPNQLASIALHPRLSRAYVVSTGASPNGPFRFNSNNQGLVSVFNTNTRLEVTAGQTGTDVRRRAPLNLNQGVNLATTPAPTLFLSNPVAMAWRPDGSDAWVVIHNSDLEVRLTVDANGIPTIGAPLVAGPSSIVRVDLQNVDRRPGKAPRGIAIDRRGHRAFVYNFISRSVTVLDISKPTAPEIVATARASALPLRGTQEAVAHLGAELFFTGRGPDGRMSQASWGGCILCHPNGRTDNVTWHFDAGPRQTIALDGMFNKKNPADQRALNWSAVRDENHDFELNTRGVFNGRGLIDDDRLFLALGGASGATPTDTALIEQFQQFTGVVSTTNDLVMGAALPTLFGARRDFAVATLSDDRVFILGGRSGSGQGSLIGTADAVLEFNPRTNVLRRRSSVGFTVRHSLGAGAVATSQGSRIYAFGGYDSTSATANPVATVQEYNPFTDTWRTVASLQTAVAQFGIAVVGGINTADPLQLIHIVSGNTGSEAAPSVSNPNPVQRFQADPTGAGSWNTFSATGLTLRRNHGAAWILRVVSSRIIVLGGQDAAGNVLTSVQELMTTQGATGNVTVVGGPHTDLPAPRARFGIGSTLTTNQIYIMGGINAAGADQATIFQLNVADNGPVAGPAGTPSGAFTMVGNLSVARRGLQVTTPPGVTNFLPVRNSGRDPRQDAIAVWVALKVRTARAPVSALDPAAVRGRQLFGQVGLVQAGFSCATCHGGPKWTRSTIDYAAPPSPDINLAPSGPIGNERVIGAELRQTQTQPNLGVLTNVGTFTLGGGRTNELRVNLADISAIAAPLGANGFNIPSLLSVHESAPYFYSGLAQTLEEVLNGSQDSFGGVRHHFILDPDSRKDLIQFLRSIDQTTPTFP